MKYTPQNTLIIIPAKDEAKSIGTVIKEVKRNGWHNILVVNDQSLDETAAVAQKNGAVVMDLPIHLGAWGAIQAGMRYALEKKYDAAITLDADGQHKGRYISKLVDKLEENQIVTGSDPERVGAHKSIIWRLLRLVSGISASDITSGFRAYPADVMKLLVSYEASILDYQCVGVLLLCKKNGFVSKEVSVKMNSRKYGNSRIFKNNFYVIRYLFSTLLLIGAKRW